jgi:hypothetical protein
MEGDYANLRAANPFSGRGFSLSQEKFLPIQRRSFSLSYAPEAVQNPKE